MSLTEADITLAFVIMTFALQFVTRFFKICDRCNQRANGHLLCKSGCCEIETGSDTPGVANRELSELNFGNSGEIDLEAVASAVEKIKS